MPEYNEFTEYPDVVTIKDLQPMLKIGRSLAYDLVHNGTIKSFRIGKNIRIPKKNIIFYLRSHTIIAEGAA